MKRIAIINSRPAFGNNAGKDALDLALILGSYEQQVSVFFHDDGVFQLQKNQQTELVEQKNYLKTFSAFELYDIENVYACKQSLTLRSLPFEFSTDAVSVLSQESYNKMLAEHDVIIQF